MNLVTNLITVNRGNIMSKRQEVAAKRVKDIDSLNIKCRYCGEQSASGSFKGYCHRWGPTTHEFVAKKPS